MVNASLNWASIVGIVLAVGGALLYFMRNFKPALARDYDVFFAAVGLLCGGILFFQGWRLDPILQFGQFLLAGTTVFFAYESVRLRGVTTEQARRSAYFDDDEPIAAPPPYRPRVGGRSWEDDGPDRLDEPQSLRRRIPSRPADDDEDDFYRPRRPSRAAIPERAASRRPGEENRSATAGGWDEVSSETGPSPRRYGADRSIRTPEFGTRRRERDTQSEVRRGSRPVAASEAMPRSSRRGPTTTTAPASGSTVTPPARPGIPQGSPIRSRGSEAGAISDADYSPVARSPRPQTPGPAAPGGATGAPERPSSSRDNSSRFDD
ncbi:MAG: Ycf66 family protein [Synechococcaceae cyanobacterium]